MLERVRRRATEVERLMDSEYLPIRQFFEGILLDGERIAASFPLLLHGAPPPHWEREIPLGDGTTIEVYTEPDSLADRVSVARIFVKVSHGSVHETRKLETADDILASNPDPDELGALLDDLKEVKEAMEQAGVVPSMTVPNSSPASQ